MGRINTGESYAPGLLHGKDIENPSVWLVEVGAIYFFNNPPIKPNTATPMAPTVVVISDRRSSSIIIITLRKNKQITRTEHVKYNAAFSRFPNIIPTSPIICVSFLRECSAHLLIDPHSSAISEMSIFRDIRRILGADVFSQTIETVRRLDLHGWMFKTAGNHL
jgi:hypothetical protein